MIHYDFFSFNLALFTDAKLLSLASISSLNALETVSFNSLLFAPNFCFFPSLSPFSLFVALCSANFLLSKSLVIGGVFVAKEVFKGVPRLNDEVDFGLVPAPEGLNEPAFFILKIALRVSSIRSYLKNCLGHKIFEVKKLNLNTLYFFM